MDGAKGRDQGLAGMMPGQEQEDYPRGAHEMVLEMAKKRALQTSTTRSISHTHGEILEEGKIPERDGISPRALAVPFSTSSLNASKRGPLPWPSNAIPEGERVKSSSRVSSRSGSRSS